jgi:acetylglutamate kinase
LIRAFKTWLNNTVNRPPNKFILYAEVFYKQLMALKKTESHIRNAETTSGKEQLFVIKIGGNIIDDEQKLAAFLRDFAAIEAKKILVHGGGKLATKVAEGMGIQQKMVDGRRITDAETLKVVTMVYAGYINKNITAQLQGIGCNAIGLSGADANMIRAHKRTVTDLEYGFVGDVDTVNADLLNDFLLQGIIPVLAPITHDGKGQLLNTNADTIARETAKGLSDHFHVALIYCFEKAGVLRNAEDDSSVIPSIHPASYKELREKNIIFGGMIPKLDNAFQALNLGVEKVIVGKAEQLTALISGHSGTTITND